MSLLIILQQKNAESDLVITLALIFALIIVWMVLRRMGKRDKRTFKSTSLRNLRQRYLKGEIDDKEYESQKRDLIDNQK